MAASAFTVAFLTSESKRQSAAELVSRPSSMSSSAHPQHWAAQTAVCQVRVHECEASRPTAIYVRSVDGSHSSQPEIPPERLD